VKFSGADWRPVTRYQSGSLRVPMTPRRLVFHTAVSSAATMHEYFNVSGRATPHFYVNDNGKAEQYIDTDFQSSANLEGNHDCITVESSDNYPWADDEVPDWTSAQEDWLVRLIVWCHEQHGITIQQLPSSKPGSTGIGWHRLGIDGNFPSGVLSGRAGGGEQWSTSTGKECPGDRKILGIVKRIIPRAHDVMSGDDMPSFNDEIPAANGKTMGDALRAALQTAEALKVLRANLLERDLKTRAALLAAVDELPEGASRKDVREAVARQFEKQISSDEAVS